MGRSNEWRVAGESQGAGRRGSRRSQTKERFWRRHVARQAAGRVSVRVYCERHGLAEPSFYAWRRELARRDGEGSHSVAEPQPPAPGSSSVGFVRLDVPRLIEGAPIEISLPGQVRVLVPPGTARTHVTEVLAALDALRDAEGRSC